MALTRTESRPLRAQTETTLRAYALLRFLRA